MRFPIALALLVPLVVPLAHAAPVCEAIGSAGACVDARTHAIGGDASASVTSSDASTGSTSAVIDAGGSDAPVAPPYLFAGAGGLASVQHSDAATGATGASERPVVFGFGAPLGFYDALNFADVSVANGAARAHQGGGVATIGALVLELVTVTADAAPAHAWFYSAGVDVPGYVACVAVDGVAQECHSGLP